MIITQLYDNGKWVYKKICNAIVSRRQNNFNCNLKRRWFVPDSVNIVYKEGEKANEFDVDEIDRMTSCA